MKKIFTLLMASFALLSQTDAQVVLNEMYGSPGASTHEFFELYNSGIGSTPSSVDGFTVITYFEEGTKKGFYVLDLPAMFIQSRGFFVGSASSPFNFQGTTNSTKTDFSWNDPLLTSKSAYLQKWVLEGSDNSDGNKDYNLYTVPASFNDFFYKKTGGGIGYSVLIYNNGLLVNTFYGAGGGATSQPSFITSMPRLNVNNVIGGVINNTFTVKFDQFANNMAEYVGADAGTDNGFIRKKDGVCNTWDKSSNMASHTPQQTNGSSIGAGSLTISGSITRGVSPATTSTATYDVTAGDATAFPVDLQVYLDNGTVPGELDALDTYLETKTQSSLSDGYQTTVFSPRTANILVVAKTSAGCFGQVRFLTDAPNSTLPVKLVNFVGNVKGSAVNLSWTVDLNETVERFEVERSVNGANFQKIATVEGYAASGLQIYDYTDASSLNSKVSYRLKMIDKNQIAEYSRIIALSASADGDHSIALMQNPVVDKLNISFVTKQRETVDIRVIDMTGAIRSTQKMTVQTGTNVLYLALSSNLLKGAYVLSVAYNGGTINQRFIRQ
jgi:hypothetical protein